MKPIRVLLADDHNIVRAGLHSLLNSFDEIEVVGEADDGMQAVRMAQELRPDIVLMDIGMPNLNGIDAAARLARDNPEVRVIILSVHAMPGYVSHAFKAGAAGYLLKDAEPAELRLALQSVASGKTYLTPTVSEYVVKDYLSLLDGGSRDLPSPDFHDALTSRQREVLQLIAEGKTTVEISRLLSIAPRTVEAHRRQIRERLGIKNTAGMIRYALKTGLVTED